MTTQPTVYASIEITEVDNTTIQIGDIVARTCHEGVILPVYDKDNNLIAITNAYQVTRIYSLKDESGKFIGIDGDSDCYKRFYNKPIFKVSIIQAN
jgi:hypothetical protein